MGTGAARWGWERWAMRVPGSVSMQGEGGEARGGGGGQIRTDPAPNTSSRKSGFLCARRSASASALAAASRLARVADQAATRPAASGVAWFGASGEGRPATWSAGKSDGVGPGSAAKPRDPWGAVRGGGGRGKGRKPVGVRGESGVRHREHERN